jgi:hypothetical protein
MLFKANPKKHAISLDVLQEHSRKSVIISLGVSINIQGNDNFLMVITTLKQMVIFLVKNNNTFKIYHFLIGD